MNWIKTKIKVSRTYLPVMNLAIYPFIGSLAIFALSYFVINPLGAFIINGISAMVDTIGQMGGGALISFIIAAGTSFDIGGPVSKGFFAYCVSACRCRFLKSTSFHRFCGSGDWFRFSSRLGQVVVTKN